MSPVSQYIFHTEVTVSIGLKQVNRKKLDVYAMKQSAQNLIRVFKIVFVVLTLTYDFIKYNKYAFLKYVVFN